MGVSEKDDVCLRTKQKLFYNYSISKQKRNWKRHFCGNTMHVEEGVRGVRISKNRTEIRINTAQNNIRKPQTALRLPEDF